MKKLFLKLFLFLLPLALCYGYMENRLYRITNSYNLKRLYFESQLGKVQVLQLGSSHAFLGVDPSLFSCYGFNLGNVSQGIFYDTRLAERYMDKMPALKLIIANIDYESFREQVRYTDEAWRVYYYLHFWDIDDPQTSYLKPERYSALFMYGMTEVQRDMKKKFKVNLAPKLQYNGYQPNDTDSRKLRITEATGRAKMAALKKGFRTENVSESYSDLDKMVQLATLRHIKVVFVTTPTYRTYYQNADPAVLAEKDSLMNQLALKYHTRYYNYLADSRFQYDDFADNDHLNFMGAGKYTRILDSEVIRPAMKELGIKGE